MEISSSKHRLLTGANQCRILVERRKLNARTTSYRFIYYNICRGIRYECNMTLALDTTFKEDELRKKALLLCMLQTLLASVIPAVVYSYVLKYDSYGSGPQAWTTWGISIIVGLVGVLAHSAASCTLTIVHIVANALLNIALAGYITAWSFILRLQCSISQASFFGCSPSSCPCAGAQSCNAVELTYAGCVSCKSPYADMCAAVNQSQSVYLLSFWGLAVLFAAAPTLYLDIYILITASRHQATLLSHLQATSIAVEQQTRLISAGDKPTVTPGTLSDWVSDLISSEESRYITVAEKCRGALRKRGYELPIANSRSNTASLPAKNSSVVAGSDAHARGLHNTGMRASYGTGQGLFRVATHSTTSFEDSPAAAAGGGGTGEYGRDSGLASYHNNSAHENSPSSPEKNHVQSQHGLHRGRLKSQQIVPFPHPESPPFGSVNSSSSTSNVSSQNEVKVVVVGSSSEFH